jgi:hypothetical protein
MSNHNYPPQSKQSCENCYYSLAKGEFDLFICRRKAPSPTFGGQDRAYWPILYKDRWCGEWAPQEVAR